MHRIIFLAKCLLRSLVRPCLQPAKLHARPAHQRVSLAWHPPDAEDIFPFTTGAALRGPRLSSPPRENIGHEIFSDPRRPHAATWKSTATSSKSPGCGPTDRLPWLLLTCTQGTPVPAEMYLHLHSLSIFAFSSVPGPFDFPSSRSRRARRL
jgi:hypothetical protein